MKDEVIPFLTAIARAGTSPFASALPVMNGTPRDSPWSPRAPEPPAPAIDAAELAALRDAAMAEGRTAGLRETNAMREKLAGLIAAAEEAKTTRASELVELVAGAAAAVVETYLMEADRAALFRPAIASWISGGSDGTIAVNPRDVAAMTEAVGDAAIPVVGDASVNAGDIQIRGTERELTLDWKTRLDELRIAIAAEIDSARAVQ